MQTLALQVKHWNLTKYVTMAVEAKWRDDLDVTKFVQAPKSNLLISLPEIDVDWFNPMAYPTPCPDDNTEVTPGRVFSEHQVSQ